jgi:hypothetical protein
LDLNGLLLAQDEGVKVWPKPYVVRDGAGSFLKFCLENFEVVFWTYSRERKIDEMLKLLQ